MYSVVINGVTVQCQDPADAVRLAREVAALNGAAPKTVAPAAASAQPSAPVAVVHTVPVEAAEMVQSKWTEPAKTIITLLMQAGADGVDTDRISETAGLAGPKGSFPLLKAIIELLGVGDSAIERSRTAEGKRRWVLTRKGAKAAAKFAAPPQAEAGRP